MGEKTLHVIDSDLLMHAPNVYFYETHKTTNKWKVIYSEFKGKTPIASGFIDDELVDISCVVHFTHLDESSIEVFWFDDAVYGENYHGTRRLILHFQ